jgi:hypothetical protein
MWIKLNPDESDTNIITYTKCNSNVLTIIHIQIKIVSTDRIEKSLQYKSQYEQNHKCSNKNHVISIKIEAEPLSNRNVSGLQLEDLLE